jgi:hypothetical protein
MAIVEQKWSALPLPFALRKVDLNPPEQPVAEIEI